ncbi:MAG: hypothetical protein HY564_02995 [Candidatus Jacksonbacteria bacterium]|nr:hypothetical protein [Candidatus Jacksonbacteria bacterium]
MSSAYHRKLFFFLLSVLGVSGIIFGIYRVYDSVYGTLRVPADERVSLTDLKNQSEEELVASILTLQTQDSDDDGLTDYEEIYVYGTSPYLKDSDSDGLSDLSELKGGTDPMCHKDRTCSSSSSSEASILNELKAQLPSYPAAPDGNTGTPFTAPDQGSNTMSGSQLRALLKQSGFPEAELNTLSDEELEKKWDEVTSNE